MPEGRNSRNTLLPEIGNTYLMTSYPFRLSSCVILAAMTVAACARLTIGDSESHVDGRTVEKLADAAIGSQLHSIDPRLLIQTSQCPAHLDLSNAKVARCTIVVDRVTLPIDVAYSSSTNQIKAYIAGSFFERRVVETETGAELNQFGVAARVRCPMPPVAVLPKGSIIRCVLRVREKVRHLDLTTRDNGRLHIELPRDLGALLDVAIKKAIKSHRSGGRTFVPGQSVTRLIDGNFSVIASAWPTKFPNAHTRCPETLDLTGNNRQTCVVNFGGHALTFAIWMKSDSIHFEPTEAIINLTQVQEIAEKMLAQSLLENGHPSMSMVDCGSGIAVVAVHSELRCKVMIGADAHTLVLDVTDVYGHVNMHMI